MNQSAINPKWQTLAGTAIAFILGFALVLFVLNIEAPKVSASANDPTTTLALGNTSGSLVIDIAPRIGVNQVGDPHTVVATVTTTGSQPAANATVNFEVVVGPSVGLTGSVTTNSSGEAPFTYSSSSTGIDIIQACVTDENSGQACDLAVKWWVGSSPVRDIDLSPDRASNLVGTSHTVTASLSEEGSPLNGALIAFEILAGPNEGVTSSATTDSSGEAPFTYTGTAVDVDTIQACARDGNSGRICDQALKQWILVAPVRTLDLSPASASNLVGTSHTVTATVADGDQAVGGALVVFEVISGPTVGVTGSATTNSSGNAPFAYTGTATGLDTIQACADNGNSGRVCDQAIKRWTPVTTTRTLGLSPKRATNPVGTGHTVTATVADGDQAVSGALVVFEVIGGPTVGATGSATTNSSGEAPFTYSGTAVGVDTIQACTSDGDLRVCDQARKQWTLENQNRFINLEPARAINPVGTSHTVIASVSNGRFSPVSGALVAFRVVSGPTVGITGSSTTNSRGEAPFTYTGTAVGVDTIQACTSDGRVCDRATKRWTEDQTPPDGTSCQGENSCRGRIVSVGANSCNAENSCNGNNISIGDNSCNEEDSCRGNTNRIANRSCNGEEACRGNNQRIEDGSCNDQEPQPDWRQFL